MKLKIFSDINYLPKGQLYEPILFPFWGKPSINDNVLKQGVYPWIDCFDNYIENAKRKFDFSSLEEADLVVLPVNWVHLISEEKMNTAINCLKQAIDLEKISVVFYGGDYSYKQLPIHCDLIFRQSMYASSRQKNDFAIPAWGEDIVKNNLNNQIIIRQKQSKATVGFCGFSAKNSFKTYAKSLRYEVEKIFHKQQTPKYNIGYVLRRYGLNALSKSSLVETNFIFSDKPFFNADNANSQALVRQQYINNIFLSDYIFCCRGYGNFSFRFYEALSCGRIPVFVNSNCVLPYDFEIDWKKYCVWVEEDEIHLIAEKVAEFHEKLSPQEFIDLQYECRKIWEQRLSPEGFFCNLYRHLDVIAKKLVNV